jgi:O-acetylserine/cysteine efflux transporter
VSQAHLLFLILINLIWGLNVVAVKVGVNHFPPLMFTAIRFGILVVLLAPFLQWYRGQMGTVFIVALTTGALHFGVLFLGFSLIDEVSTAAIAIQLFAPFSTILSMIFLHERVGWRRGLGIALAFGGVTIIGFDPKVFGYVDGLMLVVLAAFTMAVGTIFMKRLRGVSVFGLQGWLALISTPFVLLASGVLETGHLVALQSAGAMTWVAVLYTALAASLIGHGGSYYLIQRYPVSLIAPFTLLASVFAVFFSVTLLGDQLTWRIILGGVVTLLGVYILAMRQRTKSPIVET